MKLDLSLVGLPQLQDEVDRLAKDLATMEDPAAMAAAEPILAAWQGLVPFKDGNYRRSLTIAQTKDGAAVGTAWLPDLPRNQQPVLYAKPLEFGNSHQPAQPSARPAQEASRQQALEAAEVPLTTVVKGRKPRRRKLT